MESSPKIAFSPKHVRKYTVKKKQSPQLHTVNKKQSSLSPKIAFSPKHVRKYTVKKKQPSSSKLNRNQEDEVNLGFKPGTRKKRKPKKNPSKESPENVEPVLKTIPQVPQLPTNLNGSIMIVRDTVGNILLGEEGIFCGKSGKAKRYIEVQPFDLNDLKKRTEVTHALYNKIKNTIQGCFTPLVPLVMESNTMKPSNPANRMYGSHPRKQKGAAAGGGVIEYGAPKGGKEDYDGSTLQTALREFIEEVGYDFNDTTRFVNKGYAKYGSRRYAVYFVTVDDIEKTTIEKTLSDRYDKHVGEMFDLQFRDPVGLHLNKLTREALTKI